MDSIPEMKIIFGQLQSAVDDPSADWQLLLRVTCDFEIAIDDKRFYREQHFPAVEFATQASRWLLNPSNSFGYRSMETDIDPLIEFKEIGGGRFVARSPFQAFEMRDPIARDALVEALGEFIRALQTALSTDLHLDIQRLLH